MFKTSLSRNTRAKGIKLKHVLQILVLVAIGIWLIFQVKHSRDKKKELNDEDERLSGIMQNDPELLKLGRKDLDPREEKLDTGEKQDEEDEEETGEHDKEEENRDREERKHEETENDENDQEKSDNELDKEKDDGEEENSSEERDRDENTRGAREEHYKGDDASSAVTHDARSIVSQTGDVISNLNDLEHEENSSDRTTEIGNSTQDGSPQNSILNADSDGRNPEANDPDQVRTEAGNDSAQNPVSANVSVDGTIGNDPVSDNTHSDQNLTISLRDETGNGTVVVLSNSSEETESILSSDIGSGNSESEGNVGTEPG